MARSTLYRRRQPVTSKPKRRPRPHRALDETEREEVLGALHCERFVDKAPAQVWATLLDEGTYLCSIRTMYRILEEHGEVRERRNQRRHPNYTKPELLAEAPNQVWSWDITKLRGPVKWTYYYLYVILDIFSRYVVGWMLAHRESAALAQRLIAESCRKQDIEPDQLTLHADRGSSMRSKPVGLLLADLGVTKTHSRPYVSNDNPYSESQFKTMKYCPQFPSRLYVGVGVGTGFTNMDYGSLWQRNLDVNAITTGEGLDNVEQIRQTLAGSTSSAQTVLSDTLFGYQVLFGVDYALTEALLARG